jgi:ATP-binding cassette subfamily A (ABC1) protein 3
MNSLEDAFINIGMDEERFLERNQRRMSGVGKQADVKNEFTNFSDIEVPQCLKNPPTFSFIS